MSRTPRFTLVLVCAALAAGAATAASPADAAPTAHEEAVQLFEQGRAAYKEGRFQDSADLLNRAYALEKEPLLLYNLARAYEGLGQFEKAVETYELYLSTAKDIPDRGAIEQRLATLKNTIEEKQRLARERDEALRAKAAAGQAPEPAGPAPAPETASASPVPWIIAGIGVAGIAAGAGLGAVALSKDSDADGAASQVDAADLHDTATGMALGATISFIVGGVVTAGGATWGIIDVATLGPSDDAPPAKAALRLSPTSASFVVTF